MGPLSAADLDGFSVHQLTEFFKKNSNLGWKTELVVVKRVVALALRNSFFEICKLHTSTAVFRQPSLAQTNTSRPFSSRHYAFISTTCPVLRSDLAWNGLRRESLVYDVLRHQQHLVHACQALLQNLSNAQLPFGQLVVVVVTPALLHPRSFYNLTIL